MSNFLAGINTAATAAASFAGPSSSAAISTGVAALGGLAGFAGIGGGGGTKPQALHTEFASGDANWQKPYGASTDIVFYLVRADKGTSSTDPAGGIFDPEGTIGSEGFSTDLGLNSGEGFAGTSAVFGAEVQTGAGFPMDVQSPLNQVATYNTVASLPSSPISQGLAGPLTGLNVDQVATAGGANQTFAMLNSTLSSVTNSVQSVPFSGAELFASGPSENYFTDVISSSFVPLATAATDAIRTAEEIQNTLSNGSISDLSTMMSIATGGVTSSQQLIQGINSGALGFTTQSSGAQANMLGPKGFARKGTR